MRYCPRCGAKNATGDPVCRRCGQKLYGVLSGQARVDCQACGTANPSEASFCVGCGRRAGAQVSRSPVVEARPVEALVEARPVEASVQASAPPRPDELGGLLATEASLESPRATGCLVAAVVVALVAIVGAAVLFRPAGRTVALERPVATEVVVEAVGSERGANSGFVGEGAIPPSEGRARSESEQGRPPARPSPAVAGTPTARAGPARTDGPVRPRSEPAGGGAAGAVAPAGSAATPSGPAAAPAAAGLPGAPTTDSGPRTPLAGTGAATDSGPRTPVAGAATTAGPRTALPGDGAAPAPARSSSQPGVVGPALVDPVRIVGAVATPIEVPTESGSMILLLSRVELDGLTPLPGRRRLTLTATIDNAGAGLLAYDSAAFRLTDGVGALYLPLPPERGAIGAGVLPPDHRVTLQAGFEIPVGRADLTLHYQGAVVLGGLRVEG